MMRLRLWQWGVLGFPVVLILGFLVFAAGMQIHDWGLSWIWAVFTVIVVGWRLLLVRWTRPAVEQMEALVAGVTQELEAIPAASVLPPGNDVNQQAEAALNQILEVSRTDPPLWEDWSTFWKRCQELVAAIAQAYHPEVKHPLLNIYVPQAYTLIRGTVDDLDQWMEKLSPLLNQVTLQQAIQAYEVYRGLEPSARKLWQVWNWAQWLLNPVAAMTRQATLRYSNQANQQLLVNLSQLLKEASLKNLGRQAIALYSGNLPTMPPQALVTAHSTTKTQSLKDILAKAEPPEGVALEPVNLLLVGRTGSGKSSLINTLFLQPLAEVDVLPKTDSFQNYHWQAETGETLTLWDTPGYEQVEQLELQEQVVERATQADLLLLVTPALDPALQMDIDFLKKVKVTVPDLPVIVIVTQVDKLRPFREWDPPYDWVWGDRPKEISIREATGYRVQQLGEFCDRVLPLVTSDSEAMRLAWGAEALSLELTQAITPTKQLRLARFFRNLEGRTIAAAKIIDHYAFQMAASQGLTALLKSPVLSFLSTLSTGSPSLAYLLAQQIPVEQLPLVVGKLQMAYELFSLLSKENQTSREFDLLSLWPVLLDSAGDSHRNAWAFGHAITEYWTQSLSGEQLGDRFNHYLKQS